jgi:DNA-binding MarR family transcriptional regulator
MISEKSEAALIALRQILRATEINSRALAKQSGLSPSQLILLQVLSQSETETPGSLSKHLSLGQATITTLLDKLAELGMIARRKDETDRRRVLIEILDAGKRVVDETPGSLQMRFEARFSKLEEWEQSFLVAAVERIALMLDAEDIDASPVLDVGRITNLTE